MPCGFWDLLSKATEGRQRERERERESCAPRKGIPIGNLTSQIFANVYMNEFDQFVKHKLKVKYYFRYTDDFSIVSDNEDYLRGLIPLIDEFLQNKLKLELHPKKVFIRSLYQGIDFLGYIIFPHHRLVRRKTQKRAFKKLKKRVKTYKKGSITEDALEASLRSYLGVFSHADAYKVTQELGNDFWLWMNE